MSSTHQRLRRLAAVFVGIVFLVSGLLKLMDPVGTMLIVTEYAKFFHLHFLIGAAKVLGILLSLLEASLGIALITGVLRKLTAICTTVMMAFFTIVTLFLWFANPAMDCGCFGEAIHLTHLQSLVKNIILLALSVFALTPFRDFGDPPVRKRIAATLAFLSLLAAILYSHRHLPLMDFTAFDWGCELFASLDEDAEITPADMKRYPILSFRDAEGTYLDSLAAEGKAVVLSVYDPEKAPWERLHQQYQEVWGTGARPLLLVASYPEEMDRFGIPADMEVLYADYKTLITLNRSNGGGSFFNNGELVNKWSSSDFPQDLAADVADDPVRLSTHYIVRRRIKVQGFGVYMAALLILL